MARDPRDGKLKFFVDKCLPFGASISCMIYQCISDVIAHLVRHRYVVALGVINYLDDFLFVEITRGQCNKAMQTFLDVCEEVSLPVSIEKTEWSSPLMVFLGNLLDGENMMISIPLDKQQKAVRLLNNFDGKRKATVKELQVLTSYLNFLSRAIFAGRAFTRKIYAKYSQAAGKLKKYHHINLDREFRFDLDVWRIFLTHHRSWAVCRPMVDLDRFVTSQELVFYLDASAKATLGFGAIFNKKWIWGQWEPGFIDNCKPSIKYLELYALTAAILMWSQEKDLRDNRIVIFCDNETVVQMINQVTSSCKNCMHLIRVLVLDGLIVNRRAFARRVRSKDNGLSDSLLRLQFKRFRNLDPDMNDFPCEVTPLIWPVSKVWKI